MALTPEQIYGLRVRSGMDAFRPMKEHWQAKDDDATYRFARSIEAEVRKADDALIQQLVEALEGAQKHHSTTSLPLAIQNFGSREACGQFGTELWRKRVPAVITAGRARLEGNP